MPWMAAAICLLCKLQDIPVAAVQRTLSCCTITTFVFGSNCVNDEACSQIKSFGEFSFSCPASWEKTNKQTRIRTNVMKRKSEVFKLLTFSRIRQVSSSHVKISTFCYQILRLVLSLSPKAAA